MDNNEKRRTYGIIGNARLLDVRIFLDDAPQEIKKVYNINENDKLIKKLYEEYVKKNGKKPLPFNYDDWNSKEQYIEYLKREIEK